MSKYNFKLDLETENSLSMIIDMIKPNSKILEFGPANGRLTRYLKESINCIVDIVEMDDNAGEEASKYANKSFIGLQQGDIEKYIWLEELKNEQYDYIVFADVLEHLYYPEKVLRKCKKILKDDGSILISLPNIAHNSIIIDLINDEFKYNTLGLLDNTHIRFFTYNSLIRMLDELNLVTVNEMATYSRVGTNEIANSYELLNNEIAKVLKAREYGNLYQFIFEIKKKEYYERNNILRSINLERNKEYEFICYIKDNNIYTDNKTIRRNFNPGKIDQKINLKGYKALDEIRIDPISCNCIIEIKDIYTILNNEKISLPIKYTNCDVVYENNYFFNTNDPQIYIDTLNIELEYLFLEYEFKDYDSEKIKDKIKNIIQIKQLEENIVEKEVQIKQLEENIVEKEVQIKQLEENIVEKELQVKEKTERIDKMERKIVEINKVLNDKNESLMLIESNILYKFISNIRKLKN